MKEVKPGVSFNTTFQFLKNWKINQKFALVLNLKSTNQIIHKAPLFCMSLTMHRQG